MRARTRTAAEGGRPGSDPRQWCIPRECWRHRGSATPRLSAFLRRRFWASGNIVERPRGRRRPRLSARSVTAPRRVRPGGSWTSQASRDRQRRGVDDRRVQPRGGREARGDRRPVPRVASFGRPESSGARLLASVAAQRITRVTRHHRRKCAARRRLPVADEGRFPTAAQRRGICPSRRGRGGRLRPVPRSRGREGS